MNMESDNIELTDGIQGHTVYEGKDLGVLTDDGQSISKLNKIPGFKATTKFRPKYSAAQIEKAKKKKKTIGKFFSNASRFGMSFDEQIIQNMKAIPADKSLLPDDDDNAMSNQDLFNQIVSAWKVKDNRDKDFYEKDYPQKREALRELAMQPELEDILDTMSNESIVYDSDLTYFLEPFIDPNDLVDFSPDERNAINDSVNDTFKRMYRILGWRTRAWDDFKRFLIEGILAWEIVYDDMQKPTKVIGMVPLDPATLTMKQTHDKTYWIQFSGMQGKERTLLDSQVVYISFQETGSSSRVSYLERLIRPYNIYRIIEQAQIIWLVTNASYKMKFTIPVKGMGRAAGSQTLNAAMNRYREDIKFISDSGELQINGQAQMPFMKEYWMPESDAGTPEIETLGGEGPELMDSDYLKFFKNQLYKISKIPLSRFDDDSGDTWFGADATSVARTEIDFARYVTRMRNTFAQIIIKPVKMQLQLDMPQFQEENKEFLECIQMHFKSYNLFEEMMNLELMQKRVDHIQTMKESMVDMDQEGNEIKFFSSKFLVQKYLKFSDAELKLNDKLKKEEIEELNLAGGGDSEDSEFNDDDFASLKVDDLQNIITEAQKAIKKKKKKSDKKNEKDNKKKTDSDDDEIVDDDEE